GAFFKTHWASGPEWIRSALSAALVAEAAVLPLQLYYFGQVNSYVLLSNILVAPLVPVVTIAGFAASFVYLIEAALHAQFSIAAFVDRCCNFPLQLICATVFLIARAPLALVDTGKASLAAVVVYFAVLFSFSFLRQTGKLRLWAVLYALALLVLLLSLVH
ncbi:MAG: ComEC/Rec2 family competence protein, partial [Cyanobacteria bacterium]|nr:ComEC/Rec2 family competence protein [Cyanobacteriota bacterium]